MERLAFGFYRALYDEFEAYETHFSQLQRDYARELRGEILFFAVDFSELHDYIHFAGKDAHRAEINTYILNELDDQFTILPGATGELLTDLEKTVPKRLMPDFGKALYTHPAVAEFRSVFSESIYNEERLLELYVKAETELKNALGEILNILMLGDRYTSAQALQNLLNTGKLTPIQGVRQIGSLPSDAKALGRLVESYLSVSRPTQTASNQIDALDFVIALLLNQQGGPPSNRYITIYSQAISLIRACRSHDSLQWDHDYLIREGKYLQFRTKLQEMFPKVEQRHKHVTDWSRLCQELKTEISGLVDLSGQLQEKPLEPSLKLIDLYRKFDEECVQPLIFRPEMKEKPITRERVQALYNTLINEERFVGEANEAYEVLKEQLRRIHDTLNAFTPEAFDTDDIRLYKANLRKWLDLEEKTETSEVNDIE